MFKKALRIGSYCLLFLFVLILADFYRQTLFFFLLMLLLILPPASYFICKQVSFSLQPFLHSDQLFAYSTDTLRLSLGLRNPLFFPLPDCTLSYEVTSSYYPCDRIFQCNIPVYAKNGFSFDIPIHFARSGCYQVRLTKLQCCDYLHFFTFKKALSLQKEIIIYPQTSDGITFDSTAFGEGFDEYEETNQKGLVSSNVTDIREYIPGDRLQKIHWKLSAKIDKLMVKENEQTSSNQFTILVELYLPEPSSDLLEQSLSYAYTMANELLKTGEPFYFCYYCIHEGEFIKHQISHPEDLDGALLNCFYQTPYTEEDFALHLHERSDSLRGTILHISDKGVNDIVS